MVAPWVRSACYKGSLDACLLSSFGNAPLLFPVQVVQNERAIVY